MAAPIFVQSFVEHDRHKSQWRATVPESAHAHVLFLGQRIAQAGAILPSTLAAGHAVHSGAGAGVDHEGNGHGSQSVFEYSSALLEMPRNGRSGARQDRHCAELSASQGTFETRLGAALGAGPTSDQPSHVDAFGIVPSRERSLVFAGPTPSSFQGYEGDQSKLLVDY